MTNEQWIAVYVAALVLFPFIVQLMTIPLCIIADIIEKLIEGRKK